VPISAFLFSNCVHFFWNQPGTIFQFSVEIEPETQADADASFFRTRPDTA